MTVIGADTLLGGEGNDSLWAFGHGTYAEGGKGNDVFRVIDNGPRNPIVTLGFGLGDGQDIIYCGDPSLKGLTLQFLAGVD